MTLEIGIVWSINLQMPPFAPQKVRSPRKLCGAKGDTNATDWNKLRTGDYSFPGSAWERIGVEAPASRAHKLTMHFGEAEPRLH